MAPCLQNTAGDHHQAHAHGSQPQHPQVMGGSGGLHLSGVQQPQDRPRQNGQPYPRRQRQQQRHPQGGAGVAAGRPPVALSQRSADGRHQTDADGIEKGGRQGEQRQGEGVLPVLPVGLLQPQTQPALEGIHGHGLIQQGDEAHASGPQRNGNADLQQLTQHLPPGGRSVAAHAGGQPPQGQNQQRQQ